MLPKRRGHLFLMYYFVIIPYRLPRSHLKAENMSIEHPKAGIVTFKADESLLRAIEGLPNRSEFIRAAILAALENTCPLCKGTGLLTPNQRQHWQEFAHTHSVTKCDDCQEFHLLCEHEDE